MPGAWVYGVVINLTGSVCINGGTNLMKHGHNLRQKVLDARAAAKARSRSTPPSLDLEPDPFAAKPEREVARAPLSKSARKSSASDGDLGGEDDADVPKPFIWYIGTFFFVLGSILNFVSFSFAAQSLLAALGSTQFISNVFFGKVVLGEDVTFKTVVATLTIIGGNAMVVFFSSHSSRIFTAQDLLDFYDTDFNMYLLICLGAVAVCRFFYSSISYKLSVGEMVANSNLYLPLLYAITSAILGTQSVVQAKCLSILLRATMDGDNQLGNWFTYFVLFYWLGATSFWLTRMNKALSMFDGLFIIPVLQVFWTFFSIVSGGIYFEEFKSFSWGQMLGFIFGVMIVFLGVFMLSPTSKDDDAVSLGDDPDQNEQMVDRARGFSWDGPQQMNPNQRMVSVWGSTNDDVVAKVLDNDPLAKLEKATHRAVEKSVMKHQKRATMKVRSPSIPQARKSGAVEKYEDAGANI